MRVGSDIYINRPLYINNSKKNNTINFSGIKNPLSKCMFVFDLDGTLANGTEEEIGLIIKTTRQRNADLIYATGRNLQEVEKLQQKLAKKGITLPLPDYLICANGQFVYENIDGILVKDTKYEELLRAKTNFNSKKVLKAMNKLANSDKYMFSEEQLSALEKLPYYQEIKTTDPDFYKSKISYYEWNPSEFMNEYFVASDIPLKSLKKDIKETLLESGIKTKFIENQYSKPIMDACRQSILLQSHPLRRHPDGAMTALFLCPADKADGIKYLKEKLDIPYNEILMAGNDNNDTSMAELSKRGAYFICLNNSSDMLKKLSVSLKKIADSLFMTTQNGAKGILEGMSEVIK